MRSEIGKKHRPFFGLLFSNLHRLMGLNVMFVVFSLGVITIAPAWVALTASVNILLRDDFEGSVFKRFIRIFKETLGPSLMTILPLMVIVVLSLFGTVFYVQEVFVQMTSMVIVVLSSLVLAFVIGVFVHASHMMALLDLKPKAIIRNALILWIIAPARTLMAVMVLMGLIIALLWFFPHSVPVMVLIAFSLCVFILAWIIDPLMEAYLIKQADDGRSV